MESWETACWDAGQALVRLLPAGARVVLADTGMEDFLRVSAGTPEVSDQRNYLYAMVQKTTQGDNSGSSWIGVALGARLTNGDTVSGLVNGDTEIECEHSDSSPTARASHDDGDDNEGDEDRSGPGDGERGDREDDENDEDDEVACSQSDLVLNAIVHEAELKATSAGAVFEEVELVK